MAGAFAHCEMALVPWAQFAHVGAPVQVDVEDKGYCIFRTYHISPSTIHIVKQDEPDFFEKIDISEQLVGGQLVLPDDMCVLPGHVQAPELNGCVVWAFCFDHLKSDERLAAEVRLPGPGGRYNAQQKSLACDQGLDTIKHRLT